MIIIVSEQLTFVFLTVTIAAIVTDSKFSVTCYGSTGLPCAEHRLSCSTTETISITNITFGYRQGCGVNGVSSCADTACCKEESGDCFLSLPSTLLPALRNYCLNKSTCQTPGLREINKICDGIRFSAYSKIVYSCIPVTPFPPPKILPTSDTIPKIVTENTSITPTSVTIPKTPDVGVIVGGLIGALLVLVVIVLVGLFLFKGNQRKWGKTPTCVYNNKNDSLDVNLSDKPKSDYDYITTEDVGKQRSQVCIYNNAEQDITGTPDDHYQQVTNVEPDITGTAHDGHYEQAIIDIANYNHKGLNTGVPSDDHSRQASNAEPNTTGTTHGHYEQAIIGNYNHIDLNTSVPSDDNYHHLRGSNSDSIKPTTDNYNHIRSFNNENLGDDTYNHLGSEPKLVITYSEYSHIGSDNHGPSVVTDSEYSHIGTVAD